MTAKGNGVHLCKAVERFGPERRPAVVQVRIELIHVVVDAPGLKGLHDPLLEPFLVHDRCRARGCEPHVKELRELLGGAVGVALNAVRATVERRDVVLDGGGDGLVGGVRGADLVAEHAVDGELGRRGHVCGV